MANYSTLDAAKAQHPDQAIYTVRLTNGRTAYTNDPGSQYVETRGERVYDPATEAAATAARGAGIRSLLTQYGLQELAPMVDGWARDGLTWDEIEVQLRDPSTQPGQVFDRVYPEIRLRRDAGKAPVSVAQIQQFRTTARSLFRAAGLPEGFYDEPEDFHRFILNDVSPAELEERVMNGIVRAQNASPEVKDQLRRFYGIDEGGLAAYMLDPTRALPVIQRQIAAAEVGGSAVRTGFGELGKAEAEDLSTLDAGQLDEGFSHLAANQELFHRLDRGEEDISREDQLSGAFRNNANARRRIQNRAGRRVAAFEGGGGLASSRSGLSGLSTESS